MLFLLPLSTFPLYMALKEAELPHLPSSSKADNPFQQAACFRSCGFDSVSPASSADLLPQESVGENTFLPLSRRFRSFKRNPRMENDDSVEVISEPCTSKGKGKAKGKSKVGRKMWDPPVVTYFVGLLQEEKTQGYLTANSSVNVRWDAVSKSVRTFDPLYPYGVAQCQGKLKRLKEEWAAWKWLHKRTGISIDPLTGTVVIGDKEWDALVALKPALKHLRTGGLKNEEQLKYILEGTVATGDYVRSSSQLPVSSDEDAPSRGPSAKTRTSLSSGSGSKRKCTEVDTSFESHTAGPSSKSTWKSRSKSSKSSARAVVNVDDSEIAGDLRGLVKKMSLRVDKRIETSTAWCVADLESMEGLPPSLTIKISMLFQSDQGLRECWSQWKPETKAEWIKETFPDHML